MFVEREKGAGVMWWGKTCMVNEKKSMKNPNQYVDLQYKD